MIETSVNTRVSRQQVIETARSYLGTPYGSQGRSRDSLDCGGLLLVIGKELGLTELEVLGYAQNPDGETFERLLEENCDRVKPYNKPEIADILAIDYGSGIQHCSIVTILDPLTVIHAKRPRGRTRGTIGMRGVIEHRLLPMNEDLRGWVKTYRIRGVE